MVLHYYMTLITNCCIIGKPSLSCSQTSHIVKAGTSLLCECTVSGSPQPNVTWTCNDKPVDTDYVKLADTYTIVSLPKITSAQAGSYKVVAENAAGKDELTVSVTVLGKLPAINI